MHARFALGLALTVSAAAAIGASLFSATASIGQPTLLGASCEIAPASPDATVIAISAREGTAISTAALSSQTTSTGVSDLIIEPGSQAIDLIVSVGSDTILRFHGATDRIERAVVIGDHAGVVGLSPNRVSFGQARDCLAGAREIEPTPGTTAYGAIAQRYGRGPDSVIATKSLGSIGLPSGHQMKNIGGAGLLAPQRTAKAATAWARFDHYNSDSPIASIDPQTVIARIPVETYKTLPAEAGLAMLVESGALTYAAAPAHAEDTGEYDTIPFAEFKPGSLNQERWHPTIYFITEEITIPSGLYGAHSVIFLLPKGVPVPRGDLGHSTLIVED